MCECFNLVEMSTVSPNIRSNVVIMQAGFSAHHSICSILSWDWSA